ncbi:MAG: sigma factor-like helix-turn-helix DNA-binding protein [Elusimicrobiota bacterium]
MSEDKLLQRCHQDGRAFRELFNRSKRRLYSFILHLVGPLDADDLFEDVWARALKAAAGKKPDKLLRIAIRVCREQLKKGDRAQENTGTYVALFHTDEARRLGRALADLPKEQRHVFLLREYGVLGFKDIAQEVRLPLGQVLADMSAALAALGAAPLEAQHKDRCLLYESGELNEQEDYDFEKHLPFCPGCKGWLGAAQQAHAWAGAVALDPPEPLAARVLEQGPAPSVPVPHWMHLAFAAVFLAASAFVWVVSRQFSEDSPSPGARLDCASSSSVREFKLRAGDYGDAWARCLCGARADDVPAPAGSGDRAVLPPHGDQMALIEWSEANLPVSKEQAAALSQCMTGTFGWSD